MPGALGLTPDVDVRVGRAVGLAERVAAGDQRDGLLVVHRHAAERLADVVGRGERVRVAVGALRVDVDQAHLHGAQRLLEVALTGVALVPQPLGLRAPVDVLVRLPDVRAPAGEAEGLKAHRLQRDVAGEDHQVGPGEVLAVLLLDRPQQPARLVQVAVVRPAVQRREALLTGATTAATVADAVRAGAVPGHPDHERAVVAEVGRPPVLRGRQHVGDVLLDLGEVERVERRGVVELLAERVRDRRVLGQDLEVQPVRPPAAVAAALGRMRRARTVDRAALSLDRLIHVSNDGVWLVRQRETLPVRIQDWQAGHRPW